MTRVLQLAASTISLSKFALPLMRHLRTAGYVVEAMAGFDGHEEELREDGFVVHPWQMAHTFSPLAIAGARKQLRRFLRDNRYDVVHSHCSFGGIVANSVACQHTRQLIYTQHGFFVHDGLGTLSRKAWLEIEKIGLRPANVVVCISEAEHQLALSLGLGDESKFVHVFGAGVDTKRFRLSPEDRAERRQRLRSEWDVGEDVPVLLTVSRLTWDKGYAEMIEAAKQLKQSGLRFRMIAAGSGKDETGIRRRIREAGVGADFALLGWRDDIADLYSAADVFIFASHREGLPISPIEAMASGLPVIASDIPGCREELEEGRFGLLYPVGRATGLAEAVKRLLSDATLRDTLSRNGAARAARFDVGQVVNTQLDLYQRVAGKP
jgi:glycosyltransferase involved in cell wall biosynthesis